jgi:hypothetical protein
MICAIEVGSLSSNFYPLKHRRWNRCRENGQRLLGKTRNRTPLGLSCRSQNSLLIRLLKSAPPTIFSCTAKRLRDRGFCC